ncbi:MAG: ANTAR domain-containing protein [Actinobacteria bacterium]|nr:ANTAR domain-containing protein [Actinomycetota bacterium]
MASGSQDPPAGAARGAAGPDARTAEALARCRELCVRSRRLLAKGEGLRQASAARRAETTSRQPRAGGRDASLAHGQRPRGLTADLAGEPRGGYGACAEQVWPGNVGIVDAGSADSTGADRLETARLQSQTLLQDFNKAKANAQATRDQIRRGRSRREVLHDSAFARLQARLDTMPVIEQAKGIVMAKRRCGPDEAFDLLRQMSQRANVKVHVLAAEIVERVASSQNAGTLPVGGERAPITKAGRPDR